MRRRKLAVRRRRLQQRRRKVDATVGRLLHGSAWTLLGAAEKHKVVRHVHESIRRLLCVFYPLPFLSRSGLQFPHVLTPVEM